MVRGNWQARVERAERKKAERRALKAEREAGTLVQPEAVLARLLHHDPDADVWLLHHDQASQRPLCSLHFRFDACDNRRCKHSHALTIGRLRCGDGASMGDRGEATECAVEAVPGAASRAHVVGLLPGANETAAGSLRRMPDAAFAMVVEALTDLDAASFASGCRSLRNAYTGSPLVRQRKASRLPALQARRTRQLLKGACYTRLRFAASHGELVYDWAFPEVWRRFVQRLDAAPVDRRGTASTDMSTAGAEASSGGTTSAEMHSTAAPGADPGVEADPSEGGAGGADEQTALGHSGIGRHGVVAHESHVPWASLPSTVMAVLFAFSEDDSAGAACVACSEFRQAARLDAAMRIRRREGLERYRRSSKKNQREKKKKKTPRRAPGKKDAFARGQ